MKPGELLTPEQLKMLFDSIEKAGPWLGVVCTCDKCGVEHSRPATDEDRLGWARGGSPFQGIRLSQLTSAILAPLPAVQPRCS